jgi:hypothetical protein
MGVVSRLLLFQLLVGFDLTAVKFLVHALSPAPNPSFRLSLASIVAGFASMGIVAGKIFVVWNKSETSGVLGTMEEE